MKLLTDSLNFEMDFKGKKVKVETVIMNGSVSFKFYDAKLAKEAYNYEKSHSKTKVKFIEKENVLIEFYPKQKRKNIREMVLAKLKKAGAKPVKEL